MEWIPESKPPSGGLAAEGFYKLLGRPRLDPLTVLVRETAQNSWDARLGNGQPVVFGIDGWELDATELRALRDQVFVSADQVEGVDLAQALGAEALIGIYITDRNTKGLGGPVQADRVSAEGVYDWVDFVLNVGEANTQGHTGGTYGFGKTISYVVSAVNTIVIHSRSLVDGRLETRLIACTLASRFTRGSTLFTGRHWWGIASDGAPLPARGREAEDVARAIGMPDFSGDETGTNILLLAPNLDGRSPRQAMNFIAESVTWHLWPKMMRDRRGSAMDISVSWNGEPVHIPAPEERPPLHGFAQAFQAILDGTEPGGGASESGLRVDAIRSQRPKADIGRLVTLPLVHRPRAMVDDGADPDDPDAPGPAAAIVGPCHHVALLRTPELVVDYLEGPAPPAGGLEWAGVFRAADDQDRHFAASEPPTHDSWNPELLAKSPGRTIVNVGLREIRSELQDRWTAKASSRTDEVASTALVADGLAHLVGEVDGRGPGRKYAPRPPSKGGSQGRPKVTIVATAPREIDGELATYAMVRVEPRRPGEPLTVRISIAAALDGASADASLDPSLALIGLVVDGRPVAHGPHSATLELSPTSPVDIEVIARRGEETTVLFDVDAEPAS